MTGVQAGVRKASEVMALGVATIRESATLLQATELFADHRISALPVLNDAEEVTGMLTEGDFLRQSGFHLAQILARPLAARRLELERWLVREIMTHDCVTIEADTPLDEAIELMDLQAFKRLPVIAEGRLVGMLSRANLLRALVKDT